MNLPKPTMPNMRIPAGITLGGPRGESQTLESDEGYVDDLERSVRVLAHIVREDWGQGPLIDVAENTYRSAPEAEKDRAALRRVEQRLFPRPVESSEE